MTDKKKIPILYSDEINCCGCSACYAICPQQAIIMQENKQGFKFPTISEEKCIGCQLCKKVCPLE